MKIVHFTIPGEIDNSMYLQEVKSPYFYEHLHCHKEIQITWIISGEGTLITSTSMQRFRSGDLFILGSNQPHLFQSDPSYFVAGNQKSVHSLNIFFTATGFISPLLSFSEMQGIKKFVALSNLGMQASEEDAAKLSKHLLKIRNSWAGFRIAYFIELLQLMANLNNWKYLSTESFQYATAESEGFRMNEIYKYTMHHFTENISLEQIAARVFLTPHSFCRYFKKHAGKTFVKFLNEVRINEACKKFMEANFDSISTVAYQSGFNNVVSFNRVFKIIVAKTPSEFIKTYKHN